VLDKTIADINKLATKVENAAENAETLLTQGQQG